GLRQGLVRLGWSEGRNINVEYRFSPGGIHAQEVAKELIALQPDVLVAQTTPAITALQRESRTIPIAFIGVPDPVGSGFVASMARPGGNLTGQMLLEPSITGKWLGMLKEIAPHLARVGLIRNSKVNSGLYERLAQSLAPSLAVQVVPIQVETAADIE